MPKILSKCQEFTVELDGRFVLVNGQTFGFTMTDDDGRNFVVRHCKKIGVFANELGFYVPAPLANVPIIFEVKLKERYVQYEYNPAGKNRLIRSGADVFISIGRLAYTALAEHIPKLRRKA